MMIIDDNIFFCLTSQGTADIRANFKKSKHMLNVSTYAMVVLLLYNDLNEGDYLTFEVSSLCIMCKWENALSSGLVISSY